MMIIRWKRASFSGGTSRRSQGDDFNAVGDDLDLGRWLAALVALLVAPIPRRNRVRICKTTIRNILKEHGFDPGPKRGEGTWDDFIRIHAKTLWACDFISKKVWTMGGLVDYFILLSLRMNPFNSWFVQ